MNSCKKTNNKVIIEFLIFRDKLDNIYERFELLHNSEGIGSITLSEEEFEIYLTS